LIERLAPAVNERVDGEISIARQLRVMRVYGMTAVVRNTDIRESNEHANVTPHLSLASSEIKI
jgi:hypothetical protein